MGSEGVCAEQRSARPSKGGRRVCRPLASAFAARRRKSRKRRRMAVLAHAGPRPSAGPRLLNLVPTPCHPLSCCEHQLTHACSTPPRCDESGRDPYSRPGGRRRAQRSPPRLPSLAKRGAPRLSASRRRAAVVVVFGHRSFATEVRLRDQQLACSDGSLKTCEDMTAGSISCFRRQRWVRSAASRFSRPCSTTSSRSSSTLARSSRVRPLDC